MYIYVVTVASVGIAITVLFGGHKELWLALKGLFRDGPAAVFSGSATTTTAGSAGSTGTKSGGTNEMSMSMLQQSFIQD